MQVINNVPRGFDFEGSQRVRSVAPLRALLSRSRWTWSTERASTAVLYLGNMMDFEIVWLSNAFHSLPPI